MNYIVNSAEKVYGSIDVKVGKNFLLNTIPALLLLDGVIEIKNYVNYLDVEGLLDILECLGVKSEYINNSIFIDTRNYKFVTISHPKAVIRSSFMITGAMLTRNKQASIPVSYGWCVDMQKNKRDCNFHIECFKKMGAKIHIYSKENGDEVVNIDGNNMIGTNYTFPKVTITGTVNAVLAALGCDGITILQNVSLEPEVMSTMELFKRLGFQIEVKKEIREISITGNANFQPLKLNETLVLDLPSDRLVGGSFMILPLMTSGELTIKGKDIVSNNPALINLLQSMEVDLTIINNDTVFVKKDKDNLLKPFNATAKPFPELATDLLPFVVSLACFCDGDCELFDSIYDTRVLSLSKFLINCGVDIDVIAGNHLIVHGNKGNIRELDNEDYIEWLSNIHNLRGQAAAFFFLLAYPKPCRFKINFNTYGHQVTRGHPYPQIVEDLKGIGIKIVEEKFDVIESSNSNDKNIGEKIHIVDINKSEVNFI